MIKKIIGVFGFVLPIIVGIYSEDIRKVCPASKLINILTSRVFLVSFVIVLLLYILVSLIINRKKNNMSPNKTKKQRKFEKKVLKSVIIDDAKIQYDISYDIYGNPLPYNFIITRSNSLPEKAPSYTIINVDGKSKTIKDFIFGILMEVWNQIDN